MSAEHSLLHPHFTPDINLGHLVQAIVVIATVGGSVLGGYLSLRSDLDLQRAEFRVALAGHEARLTVAERLIEERRTEDRQFQAEMRAALERVMQAIGDLKTDQAGPPLANCQQQATFARAARIKNTSPQRTRRQRRGREGASAAPPPSRTSAHSLRPPR